MTKIYYHFSNYNDQLILGEQSTKPFQSSSALQTLDFFDQYIQSFRETDSIQLNRIKQKACLVRQGYLNKRGFFKKNWDTILTYFGFECQSQKIEKIYKKIQNCSIVLPHVLPIDLKHYMISFLSVKDLKSFALASKSCKVFYQINLYCLARQLDYQGPFDDRQIRDYLTGILAVFKNIFDLLQAYPIRDELMSYSYKEVADSFKSANVSKIKQILAELLKTKEGYTSNNALGNLHYELLDMLDKIINLKNKDIKGTESFFNDLLYTNTECFNFLLDYFCPASLDKILYQSIGFICHPTKFLLLIQKGANFYQTKLYMSNWISCLDFAIQCKNKDMYSAILEKIDLSQDTGNALFNAVETQNLQLVKKLVEKGANLYKKDEKLGLTPLEYAIIKNYPDIIDFLLPLVDLSQGFLLIACVQAKNSILFEYLLGKKLSINAVNEKGHSCLDKAILNEDNSSIDRILEDCDIKQGLPLHAAAATSNIVLFKRLISLGADLYAKDGKGFTCLDKILLKNAESESTPNLELINYIIHELQFDVNQGFPLHLAALGSDLSLVKELMNKVNNLNTLCNLDEELTFEGLRSVLDYAYVKCRNNKIIEELEIDLFDTGLLENAPPDAILDTLLNQNLDLQSSGWTLFGAIIFEDSHLIDSLIRKGIDPLTVRIYEKHMIDILLNLEEMVFINDEAKEKLIDWYKQKGYI